jgi:hypothetical protein
VGLWELIPAEFRDTDGLGTAHMGVCFQISVKFLLRKSLVQRTFVGAVENSDNKIAKFDLILEFYGFCMRPRHSTVVSILVLGL